MVQSSNVVVIKRITEPTKQSKPAFHQGVVPAGYGSSSLRKRAVCIAEDGQILKSISLPRTWKTSAHQGKIHQAFIAATLIIHGDPNISLGRTKAWAIVLHLFICTKSRGDCALDALVDDWPRIAMRGAKEKAILKLISCFLLSVLLLVGSGLVVLLLALGLTLLHLRTMVPLAHSREIWTGDTCVGRLTLMVP
jgi:hypothetical protein